MPSFRIRALARWGLLALGLTLFLPPRALAGADRDNLEQLYAEGVCQLTVKKNYQKAAKLLRKGADRAAKRYAQEGRTGEDAPLTATLVHLARAYRGLDDHERALEAYQDAQRYTGANANKDQQITQEVTRWTAGLMAGWKKEVKAKIGKDPILEAFAAKYPLVLLHSRRYGGGHYLWSAYSLPGKRPTRKFTGTGQSFCLTTPPRPARLLKSISWAINST
jgi:tetratricopeptide (TPR) repeat protein